MRPCLGALPATLSCRASAAASRSWAVNTPDPSASSVANCLRYGITSCSRTSSSFTSIPTTNSVLSTPAPSLSRDLMSSGSSLRLSISARFRISSRSDISLKISEISAPSNETEKVIWKMHTIFALSVCESLGGGGGHVAQLHSCLRLYSYVCGAAARV